MTAFQRSFVKAESKTEELLLTVSIRWSNLFLCSGYLATTDSPGASSKRPGARSWSLEPDFQHLEQDEQRWMQRAGKRGTDCACARCKRDVGSTTQHLQHSPANSPKSSLQLLSPPVLDLTQLCQGTSNPTCSTSCRNIPHPQQLSQYISNRPCSNSCDSIPEPPPSRLPIVLISVM